MPLNTNQLTLINRKVQINKDGQVNANLKCTPLKLNENTLTKCLPQRQLYIYIYIYVCVCVCVCVFIVIYPRTHDLSPAINSSRYCSLAESNIPADNPDSWTE